MKSSRRFVPKAPVLIGFLKAWFHILVLATLLSNESLAALQIPQGKTPLIDGIRQPGEWEDAASSTLDNDVSDFREQIIPASLKTRIFMKADANFLYALFECDDDPKLLKYQQSFRDLSEIEDRIELFLDTFGSNRGVFWFGYSVSGTRNDSLYDQTYESVEMGWNPGWTAARQIHESGYSVELAIPFSILRYAPTQYSQIWQMAAVRHVPRDQTLAFSNMTKKMDDSCYNCGSQPIELSGLPLVQVPTAKLSYTFKGERINQSNEVKNPLSVDSSWRFLPNSQLRLTLFPEYSEVDLDQISIGFNRDEELLKEERRPFFTDDAGFFKTHSNTVYTRLISDVKYGAKATVTTKDHEFGLLAVRDGASRRIEVDPLLRYPILLDVAEKSDDLIARYRWTSGNLAIGGLLTHRKSGSGDNSVALLDINVRPVDGVRIALESAQSQDMPRAGEKESGRMYSTVLEVDQKKFFLNLNIDLIDPEYAPALGFLSLTGVDSYALVAGPEFHFDHDLVHYIAPIFGYKLLDFRKATDIQRSRLLGLYIEGSFGIFLEMEHSFIEERFSTQDYEGLFDETLTVGWQPLSGLNLEVTRGQGTRVDYSSGLTSPYLSTAYEIRADPSALVSVSLQKMRFTSRMEGADASVGTVDIYTAGLRLSEEINASAIYQYARDRDPALSSRSENIQLQLVLQYLSPTERWQLLAGYLDESSKNLSGNLEEPQTTAEIFFKASLSI